MAGAAGADSQGGRRRGAVGGSRPRRGRGWHICGAGTALEPFVDAIQALLRSIWSALTGRFPFGGGFIPRRCRGLASEMHLRCAQTGPANMARPHRKRPRPPGCAPTGHAVDSPRQRRGKPVRRKGAPPQVHIIQARSPLWRFIAGAPIEGCILMEVGTRAAVKGTTENCAGFP